MQTASSTEIQHSHHHRKNHFSSFLFHALLLPSYTSFLPPPLLPSFLSTHLPLVLNLLTDLFFFFNTSRLVGHYPHEKTEGWRLRDWLKDGTNPTAMKSLSPLSPEGCNSLPGSPVLSAWGSVFYCILRWHLLTWLISGFVLPPSPKALCKHL